MSAVLEAIRAKYPQYSDRSDADLTIALGNKYPVYREQDPTFDQEFVGIASQTFRGPTPEETALSAPRAPAGAQPIAELTPEEDTRSQAVQFWEDLNTPIKEIVKPLSPEEHAWLASEGSPPEFTALLRGATATSGLPLSDEVAKQIYLRGIGGMESLGQTVNFFTSPLGIATLGIGALPKAAQRAIALAFSITMAKHGGESAGELSVEIQKPPEQQDQAKIGRLITDTAQMTGFSTLGAIGAGGGAVKPGLEWWRQPIKPLDMARQLIDSPIVKANREAAIDAAARAGGEPIVRNSLEPEMLPEPLPRPPLTSLRQPRPTELEYAGGEMPATPAIGGPLAEPPIPRTAPPPAKPATPAGTAPEVPPAAAAAPPQSGAEPPPPAQVKQRKATAPLPSLPSLPSLREPSPTELEYAGGEMPATPAIGGPLAEPPIPRTAPPPAKPATPAGTAPEVPPADDLIGMGGAVPSEFTPTARTATSIKNATVDAERAARGLPPAMQLSRRHFADVWDEAMARVDVAPETQDRLIAELKAKPRAVTDLEDALLLHRQVDLQNRYAKATQDLAQAYDDAQRFPDRLAAVEAAKAEAQITSDLLLQLYDINKAVGTATARGLNARKMLAQEDFTLAKMELEKRAAKGGEPLTDTERAELIALQERIAKTQKAFEDYQAKVEQERANRMTDEAIADMQRELKSRPTYDPRIVTIAEQIVVKLEKQADAALLRLKARDLPGPTGLHSGPTIDPGLIYDLGVVGAAKIARKGLDLARFTAEMLADFGESIRPYLQAAWERANLHLENEGAKYGDKSEPVKRLLRKEDELGRRENVVAGIKKAAKDQDVPISLLGDYIRRLSESFVRGGITARDPLIDSVHEVLTKDVGLTLTRRETMDAISGYGAFKPLNPDVVKAQLRDLRGQMQQVAKLEDLQARKPLQKTGVQRRVPSNEERRLIQQVNEAKRRFGVVVTDPAKQLKSALDAIKTRLNHQIADLEYQISTRSRIVKTRTPTPHDAEAKLLEARRDDLRRQFDEIFPRPDLTDAQRAAMAQRAIERNIADLETRIAAGDVSAKTRRPTITNPQIDALRARQVALRAEWEALRDAADPGRAERASLSALKSRLAAMTAQYQERLARGDFSQRVRREVRLDNEALRLKAIHEQAKAEFHRGLIKDRLARESTSRKIYRGAKEVLNLSRNIITSWDVSAVGRQGGILGASHPIIAAKDIKPMLEALAKERNAVMVEQEILNRPNAPLYQRSKLYLAPHESLTLTAMEEQIMSRLAHRVPGLRASNRAYITFLNKLRADVFDFIKQSVESRGTPLNDAEMRGLANYINIATGRGDLGKFTAAAEAMATAFFAPRLVASRFQFLVGQPFFKAGSWRMRGVIAQEYARSLGGIGAILALGTLVGAVVETDPRSADFGKLRFGNTRVDPLAGLAQVTVLLSRLTSGETKTIAGETRPIRGPDVPYGQGRAADVIARFLRTKLSPVIGTAVDIASGENVVGEPVTPASVAKSVLIPLSFRDIYDAMREHGIAAGTALGILSLFGWGLQYYESSKTPAKVVAADLYRREMARPQNRRMPEETRENLKSNILYHIERQMQTPAGSNAVVARAQALRARQDFNRTNRLERAISP